MVRRLACDCLQRVGTKVDSYILFEGIKEFFERQVNLEIFDDVSVGKPYFIGYSDNGELSWYADKWYKCKSCGCLWEFIYPDFPALGEVRKFKDGIYFERA